MGIAGRLKGKRKIIDVVILAQLLGGAGFLVLIIATQARGLRNFLILDFLGLLPVVVHYVMLQAAAGAAMSALYMAIDVTAAIESRTKFARYLFSAHYVLAVVLVVLAYRSPADLLALFGTLVTVVSRQQKEMQRVLLYIAISCLGWLLYGFAVGSVGQVIFSATYAVFSLFGIWRLARNNENQKL